MKRCLEGVKWLRIDSCPTYFLPCLPLATKQAVFFMKKPFWILLFHGMSCLAQAQESMKLNSLEEGLEQYTFSGKRDSSDFQISISKRNEAAQLRPLNSEAVWIGKNNSYVRYSDITITFSKPVTSVSIPISELNNDETGDEEVNKFRVYDKKGTNLTSSSSFQWLTGAASGNSNSIDQATEFDSESIMVKASYGYGASVASGRIVISNTKPFTQITFRHEVISGEPNGLYLTGDIGITFPTPPKPIKKVEPNPITPEIKEAHKPIEKPVLTPVDSTPKEMPPVVVEKASTPIVTNKTVPQKTLVKTSKTPVKSSSPVNKTPVKTSSTKKTVQSTPVKKTASTQAVVKKTPVKKVTPPPGLIKKENPPEKIHEIKEIKNMQVGEKVKLNKVFFKQSLAELLPESYPQLDTLVMILKELPNLEIELQGHTDNQGDPRLNLQLSERRVAIVKQYLVSKGISSLRLTEKGFGGNRAAVPNDTEENRRKNRRVEFMITKR